MSEVDKEIEGLSVVLSDQATRLNDGWAHTRLGDRNTAYVQIEFLLELIKKYGPDWLWEKALGWGEDDVEGKS